LITVGWVIWVIVLGVVTSDPGDDELDDPDDPQAARHRASIAGNTRQARDTSVNILDRPHVEPFLKTLSKVIITPIHGRE
jgi:hypothetical protein